MRFQNPEQFETFIAPVVGNMRIRPYRGASFDANIQLTHLEKIGMFSVRANSLTVEADPGHAFFGINVPLHSPFISNARAKKHLFIPGETQILQPADPFLLSAENQCSVLATSIFLKPLELYTSRLAQSDSIGNLKTAGCLGTSSRDGLNLQRALIKTWTSLLAKTHDSRSALVLKEIEDELLAHFALVTNLELDGYEGQVQPAPSYLHIAEDYLCASLDSPVTRDRLAEIAGVSIRTLSRAFLKRHGTGPMAFLKQRRLEAAYRELLGANPEESSVTDIAMRFGFAQLGKFSVEYRRTFGESPSATLAH